MLLCKSFVSHHHGIRLELCYKGSLVQCSPIHSRYQWPCLTSRK